MIRVTNIMSLKIVAIVSEKDTGLTHLFTGDSFFRLDPVLDFCTKESLITLSRINSFTRKRIIAFLNRKFRNTGLLESVEDNGLGIDPELRVLEFLPSRVPLLYKSYEKMTKERKEDNFRITDLNQFKIILKSIVKMGFNTSKGIKRILMVLEKFSNKIEDILTALEYSEPGLRRRILDYFRQSCVSEEGEDGQYFLEIDGKIYKIGIEGPELEQKIGIFKFNDGVYSLLSGKKYFIVNNENNYIKYEKGEFYEHGTLKNGKIERVPKVENEFQSLQEGSFYENGLLRKGKIEYKAHHANLYMNSIEGEFYEHGQFKEGKIEYEPHVDNKFQRFRNLKNYEHGQLKEDKIEYDPKFENKYKRSSLVKKYEHGQLKEGKIEYEPHVTNKYKRSTLVKKYEHGQLKEDKIEYDPKFENKYKRSREVYFYGNGRLKEDKIEYVPSEGNSFKKSEKGEFYRNEQLKKGIVEYVPNEENSFKKSEKGEWSVHGCLKESVENYSERTFRNFGFLNWTYGKWFSIPGTWI
tara:strand:- start:1983 stop:3551 length:1569 start_codon:yes stop_codon:yes gene_type:complete